MDTNDQDALLMTNGYYSLSLVKIYTKSPVYREKPVAKLVVCECLLLYIRKHA